MGFSKQEYWSGVPLPSPRVLIGCFLLLCQDCHNKILQTSGLNNRNSFSYNSESCKSQTKVSASFVSSEASFWGCRWPTSLYVLIEFSICGSICPNLYVYVLISSSQRDICQTELGPTLMTSFYINFLFKEPVSKYSHILSYWGLGYEHMNLGGTQFIL